MKVPEAVAALVDDLGADLNVQVRPAAYPGPTGLRCAVMWDRKYPPTDRPRVIMRAIMNTQGIDPAEACNLFAFPKRQATAPLRNQIEEWRESTLDNLESKQVKYVLLVGKGCHEVWRPELKMEQVEAKWGVLEGKWICMVVKNPLAAVIDPSLQSEWRQDMVKFCEGVTRDYGISELSDVCTEGKCNEGVWIYDQDGLPWCKGHAEDGFRKRRNMRAARAKKANKREEGQLEL